MPESTDQSYDKAARLISLDRDKTPQYSLGGFNCTDWVFKVADAAGVKLPSAGRSEPAYTTPRSSPISTRCCGASRVGATSPAGTRCSRTRRTSGPTASPTRPRGRSTSTPPQTSRCWRSSPHSVIAHEIDMTACTAVLPAETVGAGRPLTDLARALGHVADRHRGAVRRRRAPVPSGHVRPLLPTGGDLPAARDRDRERHGVPVQPSCESRWRRRRGLGGDHRALRRPAPLPLPAAGAGRVAGGDALIALPALERRTKSMFHSCSRCRSARPAPVIARARFIAAAALA